RPASDRHGGLAGEQRLPAPESARWRRRLRGTLRAGSERAAVRLRRGRWDVPALPGGPAPDHLRLLPAARRFPPGPLRLPERAPDEAEPALRQRQLPARAQPPGPL